MKHVSLICAVVFALGVLVFGCRKTPEPIQAPELQTGAFNTQAVATTLRNYTLGDIEIPLAPGTGIVAAGVGLDQGQPGDINIDVPGDVKQVLLYWNGFMKTLTTDDEITVNGTPVTGTLLGGPVYFFFEARSSNHRADITAMNVIHPGANTISIGGMDFTRDNNGAGIIVIYDDGTGIQDIRIKDGHDLAFYNFPDPLKTMVPQTFTFPAAAFDRKARITNFAASVATDRPNVIDVTIGATVKRFVDPFHDTNGSEWDTHIAEIDIPAGISEVTVEPKSEADPTTTRMDEPASFVWIASGLAILPEDEDCGPCDGKVTELTLQYNGVEVDAHIVASNKHGLLFDDILQPGDQFTVYGNDNGTLGTEITVCVNPVDGDGGSAKDGTSGKDGGSGKDAGTVGCVRIHTSCSKPIGPGLVAGDFEVISGESKNGGPLCPLGTGGGGDDCSAGKPQVLTVQYTGEDCSASNHSQAADKVDCNGDPNDASPVYILASDKQDPSDSKANTYFAGSVNLYDEFDINALDGGQNNLKANTYVFIYESQGGALLQSIKFHTSCSQPLSVGDQFGSILITGFTPEGGTANFEYYDGARDMRRGIR